MFHISLYVINGCICEVLSVNLIHNVQSAWTVDEAGLRRAQREDVMMVLQNLEYILIKSSYDTYQQEVR